MCVCYKHTLFSPCSFLEERLLREDMFALALVRFSAVVNHNTRVIVHVDLSHYNQKGDDDFSPFRVPYTVSRARPTPNTATSSR